jgi:hypothetical protein
MPKYSDKGSYYYELQQYLDDISDSMMRELTETEISEYTRLFWQEH